MKTVGKQEQGSERADTLAQGCVKWVGQLRKQTHWWNEDLEQLYEQKRR